MTPGLSFLVVFGLLIAFSFIIRKIFNVEQSKIFSNTYLNNLHRNIDWIIRILAVISMIIGAIINHSRGYNNSLWYLEPISILLVTLLITNLLKVIMEKKHDENPNAYKATLAEMLFTLLVLVLLTIFYTNFFGIL